MIEANHILLSDWLKTTITALIGAVVGFVSAIASELFKNSISDKRKRRKMQLAIYSELMWVYDTVMLVVNATPANERQRDNLVPFITNLRFDAYEFAKRQPDIFYELMEAYPLDELYGHLLMIKANSTTNGVFDQCYAFLDELYRLTRGNILDTNLLKGLSAHNFAEISKEAERYHQHVLEEHAKATEKAQSS